jgi:hypothetical protein
MRGWLLIVVGLAVFGFAAAFGVISWEVTLAVIVVGLVVVLLGAYQVIRDRRQPMG